MKRAVVPGVCSLIIAVLASAGCSRSGALSLPSGQPGAPAGKNAVVTAAAQELAPGQQGRDYLGGGFYDSLVVEVDYMRGAAPDPDALRLLEQRLRERCSKPGGVKVVVDDEITDQAAHRWTLQEIALLERQHRDAYPSLDTAVLYFVYLEGAYEQENVLGIAYTGSALCIFKDVIEDSITNALAGGLLGPGDPLNAITGPLVEQAVLVHEAGHNLGLVNIGIPMVHAHEDGGHRGHDPSTECVMHWSLDTSEVAKVLDTIPNDFCDSCIEDMRAVGGK